MQKRYIQLNTRRISRNMKASQLGVCYHQSITLQLYRNLKWQREQDTKYSLGLLISLPNNVTSAVEKQIKDSSLFYFMHDSMQKPSWELMCSCLVIFVSVFFFLRINIFSVIYLFWFICGSEKVEHVLFMNELLTNDQWKWKNWQKLESS